VAVFSRWIARGQGPGRTQAILRWLASLTILVLVAWRVGPREIVATLSNPHKLLLLATFLVMLADVGVRSLNWQRLMRAIGIEVGWRPLGFAYLSGGFWGLLLPSSLGMDVARAKIAAKVVPMPLPKALASMASLNALGLLAGTLLGVLGAAWLFLSGVHVRVALTGGMLAVALLAGIVLAHWLVRHATRWVENLQWQRGRLWHWLHRFILGLAVAFRPLGDSRQARHQLLLVALLSQSLRPVILWLACLTVGVTVPWAALVLWIPLGNLVNFLPISVAGFGGLQAVQTYYFAQFGVDAHAGFAASIVAQVMQSMVTLLGGLIFAASGARQESRPVEPDRPADER
jgi:uncharacterized protein (TIRG00374 family)